MLVDLAPNRGLRDCRRESPALEGGDASPSWSTFSVRRGLRCALRISVSIRRGTSAPMSGQSDSIGPPNRVSTVPRRNRAGTDAKQAGTSESADDARSPEETTGTAVSRIGVTATWHGLHLVGVQTSNSQRSRPLCGSGGGNPRPSGRGGCQSNEVEKNAVIVEHNSLSASSQTAYDACDLPSRRGTPRCCCSEAQDSADGPDISWSMVTSRFIRYR